MHPFAAVPDQIIENVTNFQIFSFISTIFVILVYIRVTAHFVMLGHATLHMAVADQTSSQTK